MDNPGDEAASAAYADGSATDPRQVENPSRQVENPSPPDVTAGNGKEGDEADTSMSPIKPTSMDIDCSTGQTSGRVSNANTLITASSNTSASASASSSAQAASAAPTIYTHACFLCCRKFTSLEQLLKHQGKSKLHKANLERVKSLKKEKVEPESESELGEKKTDAGQDAQNEKDDDSSDGSDCDDEDEDSDVDSESADGTSSTARSSKRKHKSAKRSSKPRRPSVRSRAEGPVQVWRCSSCNDAYFDTYDEAFEHEARCARRARRESSMVDSSSEGDMDDDDEADSERIKEHRAIARAEAKEREALQQKKWKEEDAQLKTKGIEQGGKGVPFNLTAEDKKILSDYNGFLFENIEMFVVDQNFNDQLATSGTGSGKHRTQGTVGLRCVHCKYRPYGERAASSCVFPRRLSIFGTHLHQIVSTHFPHCQSLPDDFHEQVKTHKDNLPMQSYLHGFLGINAFMEKHGTDRWNLEESHTGLHFAGTELVQSDSDSDNEIADDAKNRNAAKSTSNILSSATSDGKDISPPPTKKRSISGGDTSSEKPKKKRGRPRLSDVEKQQRQKERQTGKRETKEKEKKKEKKKKRRKKTPDDLLLESIADQVPFGLSKSDPKDAFSPLHKLLREATEIFIIRTRVEAIDLTPFGDPLLKVGSCGLRCKFCQDHCVFPAHVEDIYNKVRRGIQDHISSGECDAMTPSLKRRYFAVENEARSSNISTLYRNQAKEVGLYDIGEREGLGLRGVSNALINANIEGSDSSSSSNANSASDGEEMSVSSSSSSAENEIDNETVRKEDDIKSNTTNTNTNFKKKPVLARNAADVCKHPGCNKYKQARCEGFCIRHHRESQALFDSDLLSSDEKGARLCSVRGCTKNSRSDGNGMCRGHHTESLKRKNSKRDKSPTGTTDRPKDAKGGRICSVPGCTKLFQYKCDGMCYRHHSASKKESNEAGRESDNDSSDDLSSSSSESEIEHPLVSDLMLRDERSSISPYRLKLLSSLQLCYLSPKDAAKNHKRKDLPLGMPGVRCKYCHTQKVFGIADTLWFNVSKGKQKSHLDECPGIHYRQKLHLDRLEREEDESDRSMFSAAVPKSLRAKIYKRMVERATSEKYLSKKAGKKLLKTAKERDSSSRKRS